MVTKHPTLPPPRNAWLMPRVTNGAPREWGRYTHPAVDDLRRAVRVFCVWMCIHARSSRGRLEACTVLVMVAHVVCVSVLTHSPQPSIQFTNIIFTINKTKEKDMILIDDKHTSIMAGSNAWNIGKGGEGLISHGTFSRGGKSAPGATPGEIKPCVKATLLHILSTRF